MTRINDTKTVCEMSAANQPIITVESGDIIEITTKDCFSGRLEKEEDLLCQLPWDSVNPCSSPIFVKGAEKGDTLKVEVLDIIVDNHGVIIREKEDMHRYTLTAIEKSMHVSVHNNMIELDHNINVPISPMIGVIGTAPEYGAISTTLPGEHGGNMDNARIKAGSVVYLPVFHKGALLSIGDLHASMGDGEAAGCGIEISGRVLIKVTTVKEKLAPLPVVDSDGVRMTVASAESIDQASEKAVSNMMQYLVHFKGVPIDLAWKMLAACGDVRICQYANKLKTVRCEMPISLIEQVVNSNGMLV